MWNLTVKILGLHLRQFVICPKCSDLYRTLFIFQKDKFQAIIASKASGSTYVIFIYDTLTGIATAGSVRVRSSSFIKKSVHQASTLHPVSLSPHLRRKKESCGSTVSSLMIISLDWIKFVWILTNLEYGPRQANLCLRAFHHDKFQLRLSSHSEGPGIWLSAWRFLLIHCLYKRAAEVLETVRMRRLAWTFAARIGDKYQIRLTRSIL